MKIALASPYDFANYGGVNQHIDHLKGEFTKLGHRVVIIAPLSDPNKEVNTADFHGFGGVFPISANGSIARISFSLNLRRRIRHLMETEHFDIVHCHEPLMPALPLAVLRYSRSTNIGTFHAFAQRNLGYFYARPVLQTFFNKLDGMIAVSEPAREFASQYFNGDWEIIPNGVDTRLFSRPYDPFPELMDGRPNILFLGRFEEKRKGFRYALRALPWVKDVFPNVRLVVVGKGNPSRYYESIQKYGIQDNVMFTGSVNDQDRSRYMASCQFLVAPSTRGESQGIVILEAMAAGLPVIAGNIPGYASVIRSGQQGLLVPPENEHALAIAMVRLLSDANARAHMGSSGRTKAEEYSWPRVASRVLEYYTEVRDRKIYERTRDERRRHLRVVLRKARRV